MKSFKQMFNLIVLFFCFSPLFGQEFSRGAILDPSAYERIDAKPGLLSRDYTSVPRSVSLKQYAPAPESQGRYGTCVGWSTAFAARTISESIALDRVRAEQNSANAFSPIYLYKSITNDPEGDDGAAIPSALELMKKEGIVKRLPEEKGMDYRNISLSMFGNNRRYPISGYVKLFSNPRGNPGTVSERALPVKKSLAGGKPVIIGMNCPDSFFSVEDIWRPLEGPYRFYGGHAMCVVGYDDGKYGGAFEIQNSWGTNWGNGGYGWIRYEDFASYVDEAYEIIENLAIYRDAARYAASVKIELYKDTQGMPVVFDGGGFYKTRASYPSGTEFRFLMNNKYPAYVYAFAADSNTPGTERIFPLDGVSPVMDYPDSTIAWPGENSWIRLNDVVGTDYLVVLYAKEALDINAIEKRFAGAAGTFAERAAWAVGPDFIPYADVHYSKDTVEFQAASTNPKAVFGLLLAISHR